MEWHKGVHKMMCRGAENQVGKGSNIDGKEGRERETEEPGLGEEEGEPEEIKESYFGFVGFLPPPPPPLDALPPPRPDPRGPLSIPPRPRPPPLEPKLLDPGRPARSLKPRLGPASTGRPRSPG